MGGSVASSFRVCICAAVRIYLSNNTMTQQFLQAFPMPCMAWFVEVR